VKVVISATIRNVETFEVFRKKCGRMPRERRAARERADMVIEEARLTLNESVWVPPRPRVFWYAVGAEIRIVEVLKKK